MVPHIDPTEGEVVPDDYDQNWYADHVQESKYTLQVVKCDQLDCCGAWQSGLKQLLKS